MIFQFFNTFSPSVLSRLDDEIRSEVIPFVKAFQSLPNTIQDKARAAASSEDPVEFFAHLHNAWQAHNALAYKIDVFLSTVYAQPVPVSHQALTDAYLLLNQALTVEDEKRIYSAGVKLILDKYLSTFSTDGNLSSGDLKVVFTPWYGDFWTSYRGKHIEFIYSRDYESSANPDPQYLIDYFHGGIQELFLYRLARDLSEELVASQVSLFRSLDQYRQYTKKLQRMRQHGLYLTRCSKKLQYIQKLVSYDNFEEYVWASNLYGLPDLYLRRWVVNQLVENHLIDKRPGVLFYSSDELLSKLRELEQTREGSSSIIIKSEVPTIFLQTRGTTCGVACTMMAMNFFVGTPLSTAEEGRLRKKLKLNRYDLIPAVNLARYMLEHGLTVKVVHQDSFKFWETMRLFSEDILEQQERAYEHARRKGVSINHMPVILDDINRELEQGSLVIYGINLSEHVKHAILIYGHSSGAYYAVDPLVGVKVYASSLLWDLGDMNTGRWYISVGNKQLPSTT